MPEAVVTVKPRVSAGGSRPNATKIDWHTRLHDRVTASVTMDAQYELPPELMFDLLADPRQHANIFGAIQVSFMQQLQGQTRATIRPIECIVTAWTLLHCSWAKRGVAAPG